MPLSWNEIKDRARAFARDWAHAESEDADAKSFWDAFFNVYGKGVDIKIGIDISSIAFKKLATKIVLISGDADFVPAAKLARREGIDFVLDPMWQPIPPDLHEHIDGLHSPWNKPPAVAG